MNDIEFAALVEKTLAQIEQQVDYWVHSLDIDIEAYREGNMLTLEFENKVQVVINSQPTLHQLWVAAPNGGFHYRYYGSYWYDKRNNISLQAILSQIFSQAYNMVLTIEL